MKTDIEQARELLAKHMRAVANKHNAAGLLRDAEVVESGEEWDFWMDAAHAAVAEALRAAPEREFRDPDDLAEYLGSLVSDDEEWDAAQAAMWGVRAFQGDVTVQERLQAAIEGECGGLAITEDQAVEILHYVLQPLYYADDTPTLANATPPQDLRTQLGEVR